MERCHDGRRAPAGQGLELSQLRVEKLEILDSYDIQNASKWDVDILVTNAAIGIGWSPP